MNYLSFLLFTLVFACCVLAAPVADEKRAVSMTASLLNTFNLMEQYASAAYCKTNYNSPGNQIICKSGTCPLVQAANATSMIEYASTLSTDVTGYVAIDPTNAFIILSFRGSASLDNWLTNLNFKARPTNLCPGCTAHAGFWQSWLDARSDVLAALKSATQAHPDYKIVATGHSLGGAIATLAAADLRAAGFEVALYSFGAPRVAGATLSAFISNQAGGNYRITHWNDPVPRLPPLAMNFVHVSPEYYINKGNGQAVGLGDMKIYQGSVNTAVGNGAWIATDILAHLWYFNGISNCSLMGKRAGGREEGEGEKEGEVDVVAKF